MIGECGSCAQRAAQRQRAARVAGVAPSTTEAYKVTDLSGECLLYVGDDGPCRTFADTASATSVAMTELGSTGWTVTPIRVL